MRKRARFLALLLVLLLASCGQAAAPEITAALPTTEAPTTTEVPYPADSEPTASLLERHAEEILLAQPVCDHFSLSKNKTVIGAAVGDLNGDGKPDLAAVVELALEEGKRETYILLAEKSGYKVRHTNRGLIMPAEMGNIWGDSFKGLSIENGVLTISVGANTMWLWSHEFRFQYRDGALALAKTESVYLSINSGNGAKTICDYMRNMWESRVYSEAEKLNGLLLYKSAFHPAPSTFDAPIIDGCTYNFGIPHGPSFGFYEFAGPKTLLNISTNEALDMIQKKYYSGLTQKRLPWTAETKANYEKILPYDMPDYYYEDEKGILRYYEFHGDDAPWHTVIFEPCEKNPAEPASSIKYYRIDDVTGNIID